MYTFHRLDYTLAPVYVNNDCIEYHNAVSHIPGQLAMHCKEIVFHMRVSSASMLIRLVKCKVVELGVLSHI